MRCPRRLFLLGLLFWISVTASDFIDSAWGYLTDLAGFCSGLFLLVALPITAIAGISKYGFFSKQWLLQPTICSIFIFGFFLLSPIQAYLTDLRFQWQLPEYAYVVDGIKTGRIQGGNPNAITDFGALGHLPGRARAVWFDNCGVNNIAVTFMIATRGGAVGPHWGYIYDDCPGPAADSSPPGVSLPYKYYRHIRGAWYQFYQP